MAGTQAPAMLSSRSERELQLQLQVARRVGTGQRAERLIAVVHVQAGEVRDVESVEEVRLELEVPRFANGEVLRDGQVIGLQPWSADDPDTGIAEAVVGRGSERRLIDPIVDVALAVRCKDVAAEVIGAPAANRCTCRGRKRRSRLQTDD